MNPPVQLRVNSSVNYSVNPECSHHRVILKKLQNFIVPSNFFVVVEETKKRHKQDFGETTTDQDCRETRRYPERFTLRCEPTPWQFPNTNSLTSIHNSTCVRLVKLIHTKERTHVTGVVLMFVTIVHHAVPYATEQYVRVCINGLGATNV